MPTTFILLCTPTTSPYLQPSFSGAPPVPPLLPVRSQRSSQVLVSQSSFAECMCMQESLPGWLEACASPQVAELVTSWRVGRPESASLANKPGDQMVGCRVSPTGCSK